MQRPVGKMSRSIHKEEWKEELERSRIKFVYQETGVAKMATMPLQEHKLPVRQVLVRGSNHWKYISQSNLGKRPVVRHNKSC